jgi:hypothetical protein
MRPLPSSAMAALALGLALAGCGGGGGGTGKSGISVVSGTYGASCGAASGNATSDLKTKCDGQDVCDYTIDAGILGDPKKGCAKDYEARWTCGGDSEVHIATVPGEAGFRKQVQRAS